MKGLHLRTVCSLVIGGSLVLIGVVLVRAKEPDDSPSVQVRYHQVLVQLAEVELKVAEELNQKVPHTVAGLTMERLRTNVAVARELHERAARGYRDMPETQVLYADARAQLAEKDYQTAVEVRKRNPNAMPELKLEKLRLTAELAKLRVEMWKYPEGISSLVEQMQWEIDQLNRDVLELHKRLERLE